MNSNHPASQRHTFNRLALGAAHLPCALPSMAQQASDGWLTQPTMTGDWGGLRSQLQDDGILQHGSCSAPTCDTR